MGQNFRFYRNCVNWPADDVDTDGGLCDVVADATPITRATFLKKIDRAELARLEAELGYAAHPRQGLTMAGDYHVEYARSRLHGRTCYFFKHSAIEFVFTD